MWKLANSGSSFLSSPRSLSSGPLIGYGVLAGRQARNTEVGVRDPLTPYSASIHGGSRLTYAEVLKRTSAPSLPVPSSVPQFIPPLVFDEETLSETQVWRSITAALSRLDLDPRPGEVLRLVTDPRSGGTRRALGCGDLEQSHPAAVDSVCVLDVKISRKEQRDVERVIDVAREKIRCRTARTPKRRIKARARIDLVGTEDDPGPPKRLLARPSGAVPFVPPLRKGMNSRDRRLRARALERAAQTQLFQDAAAALDAGIDPPPWSELGGTATPSSRSVVTIPEAFHTIEELPTPVPTPRRAPGHVFVPVPEAYGRAVLDEPEPEPGGVVFRPPRPPHRPSGLRVSWDENAGADERRMWSQSRWRHAFMRSGPVATESQRNLDFDRLRNPGLAAVEGAFRRVAGVRKPKFTLSYEMTEPGDAVGAGPRRRVPVAIHFRSDMVRPVLAIDMDGLISALDSAGGAEKMVDRVRHHLPLLKPEEMRRVASEASAGIHSALVAVGRNPTPNALADHICRFVVVGARRNNVPPEIMVAILLEAFPEAIVGHIAIDRAVEDAVEALRTARGGFLTRIFRGPRKMAYSIGHRAGLTVQGGAWARGVTRSGNLLTRE